MFVRIPRWGLIGGVRMSCKTFIFWWLDLGFFVELLSPQFAAICELWSSRPKESQWSTHTGGRAWITPSLVEQWMGIFLSDLLGVYGAMWGLVWWTNALNKTISPGSLEFLSCVKFIVAMLFSTAYFKFAVCLEWGNKSPELSVFRNFTGMVFLPCVGV